MNQPVEAASLPIAALTGDPVVRVGPTTPLQAIAGTLVEAEVGAVVVGAGERPEGIVSERDIVHAIAAGVDPSTTAGELAHTSLIWCDAEATVGEVAGQMMDRYVRHILVEEDGRLLGIVSARDLLGVYASD